MMLLMSLTSKYWPATMSTRIVGSCKKGARPIVADIVSVDATEFFVALVGAREEEEVEELRLLAADGSPGNSTKMAE